MLEFENPITMHGDIGEVLDLAMNLTRIPEWNYTVNSVTHRSGLPGGVGAIYHGRPREGEPVLEIVEGVRNERFVVEALCSTGPELRSETSLSQACAGTQILDRGRQHLGVARQAERLAAGQVRQVVRDKLGKLKVLIEDETVMHQDGRITSL